MYRRILVPVDASPCSVKRLTEALQLASALNARVLLLHVVNGLLSDAVLAPTEYRHVDAAKSWGADLIVMGTHGRRGMSRLAMGSDAELVVRSSPVPVLLVRGQIDR